MTDTNKFEEDFPSLKYRVQRAEDIIPNNILCVSCFSVYSHCLDKQKVRGLILKIQNKRRVDGMTFSNKIDGDELLKELGL